MKFLLRANRAFHAMSKSPSPVTHPSPLQKASPSFPPPTIDPSSTPVATSESGAGPGTKVYEGVFALNKPLHISSAQALRDLQAAFDGSRLFGPWVAAETERRAAALAADPGQRKRRGRRAWKGSKPVQVKMGHGGTLDPLATGVLIVGVGRGTKRLGGFLACTKRYRAALLFGAATDTYDRGGRVLGRAPHAHVTRAAVDAALPRFRGDIMQQPPVYSALHMDGKRLYEYAREGKELPKEIEKRPTRVDSLEITAWLDPGTHQHTWPEETATTEERTFANKVLHLDGVGTKEATLESAGSDDAASQEGLKRKREEGDGTKASAEDGGHTPVTKRTKDQASQELLADTTAATAEEEPKQEPLEGGEPVSAVSVNSQVAPQEKDLGPPAVELDMTVTSGFYVRSLCHDLGKAVGSLGMMASLVRTRQGDFSLENGNVLEYEDLAKGEEVWGPKVQAMLEAWEAKDDSATKNTVQ